jgi:hypothetical protein
MKITKAELEKIKRNSSFYSEPIDSPELNKHRKREKKQIEQLLAKISKVDLPTTKAEFATFTGKFLMKPIHLETLTQRNRPNDFDYKILESLHEYIHLEDVSCSSYVILIALGATLDTGGISRSHYGLIHPVSEKQKERLIGIMMS